LPRKGKPPLVFTACQFVGEWQKNESTFAYAPQNDRDHFQQFQNGYPGTLEEQIKDVFVPLWHYYRYLLHYWRTSHGE
jgi:hypothetical protein